MSSSPRLMTGQGAIIAAGAIDYPAEYLGAADETRAMLGISKVMTLSCTYDHRIIQGAESGMFLGRVQALLGGNDGFFQEGVNPPRMPPLPARLEAPPKSPPPALTPPPHPATPHATATPRIIPPYSPPR